MASFAHRQPGLIKRIERFLHTAAILEHAENAHFVVVGDGELRLELEESPRRAGLVPE
jgi:hypothetical protein